MHLSRIARQIRTGPLAVMLIWVMQMDWMMLPLLLLSLLLFSIQPAQHDTEPRNIELSIPQHIAGTVHDSRAFSGVQTSCVSMCGVPYTALLPRHVLNLGCCVS